MSIYKNWKVIVLLVGLAIQGIVINKLISGGSDNVLYHIAGEIPEPGSILFLVFGGLWIRKQNRKRLKKL